MPILFETMEIRGCRSTKAIDERQNSAKLTPPAPKLIGFEKLYNYTGHNNEFANIMAGPNKFVSQTNLG